MVFLKLVCLESEVNHKTQPIWVKVVHLVPNVQTLAGHAIGTIGLAVLTPSFLFRQVATDTTSHISYF